MTLALLFLLVEGAAAAAAKPHPANHSAALPKLKLGPDNCVDMFGAGISGGGANGSRSLFDEQEGAGDPASNGIGSGVMQYPYMMGWTKWQYASDPSSNGGIQALIDLKSVHAISDIWLNHYHGNVWAKIEIFLHSPFDPKPVWSVDVNTTQVKGLPVHPPPVCHGWGYAQKWCGWNISNTEADAPKGRYIVLSPLNPISFYEMVVYGKAQAPPQPPKPVPPPRSPLMGPFIGVNSFVTEPLQRQVAAGWIREYHDWQWDEGSGDACYPHATVKFSPDYSSFQADPFYQSRAAAGLSTHVVLQGRPLCQFGGHTPNLTQAKWKCVDNNAYIGTPKTLDPASYVQLGAYAFQYAARYGKRKVADAKLKLAPGQTRVSGQGWLSGIEVRNEANGAWEGREHFMTPAEQAALLSTCYDGHEGTVGTDKTIVGVRQADPGMLVSMGGLSGATTVALDIVRTMRLWFQSNRKDGRFAADALNFHFYCNDDQVTKGASPEECDFEGVAKGLTAWRDANEPHMQVWLSEFGYDTDIHSPNLAPAYGAFDAQDVQGMWIIRSFLYLALARIDRAQMFMLADTQDNGWNKFATSGLTNCGCNANCCSNYRPKKSWYMVSTMTRFLEHTRFDADLTAKVNGKVRVVRFKRDSAFKQGPSAVYVLWLGSKTGASASVNLDVGAEGGLTAVLAELSGNSTTGVQSALPVSSGKVKVTVTEMPVFILIGHGITPEPPSGPVPPIDPPVAPKCTNLRRGLNCTGGVPTVGSYIVCPGGHLDTCPDGDQCVQVSPGIVNCTPVPSTPCADKPPGLFCDASASKPGWPDPYIACPEMEQYYCTTERPHCVQAGATVNCTNRTN